MLDVIKDLILNTFEEGLQVEKINYDAKAKASVISKTKKLMQNLYGICLKTKKVVPIPLIKRFKDDQDFLVRGWNDKIEEGQTLEEWMRENGHPSFDFFLLENINIYTSEDWERIWDLSDFSPERSYKLFRSFR